MFKLCSLETNRDWRQSFPGPWRAAASGHQGAFLAFIGVNTCPFAHLPHYPNTTQLLPLLQALGMKHFLEEPVCQLYRIITTIRNMIPCDLPAVSWTQNKRVGEAWNCFYSYDLFYLQRSICFNDPLVLSECVCGGGGRGGGGEGNKIRKVHT